MEKRQREATLTTDFFIKSILRNLSSQERERVRETGGLYNYAYVVIVFDFERNALPYFP